MFAVKTQIKYSFMFSQSCIPNYRAGTSRDLQSKALCSSFSSARHRTDRTGSLLLNQFPFVQNDTTKRRGRQLGHTHAHTTTDFNYLLVSCNIYDRFVATFGKKIRIKL